MIFEYKNINTRQFIDYTRLLFRDSENFSVQSISNKLADLLNKYAKDKECFDIVGFFNEYKALYDIILDEVYSTFINNFQAKDINYQFVSIVSAMDTIDNLLMGLVKILTDGHLEFKLPYHSAKSFLEHKRLIDEYNIFARYNIDFVFENAISNPRIVEYSDDFNKKCIDTMNSFVNERIEKNESNQFESSQRGLRKKNEVVLMLLAPLNAMDKVFHSRMLFDWHLNKRYKELVTLNNLEKIFMAETGLTRTEMKTLLASSRVNPIMINMRSARMKETLEEVSSARIVEANNIVNEYPTLKLKIN